MSSIGSVSWYNFAEYILDQYCANGINVSRFEIKPIKTKDKYKLLLRPQGSPFGSNLVINLETDQNIPLTNIDNFIDTLGDNKRKWIKAINKKIKSNRNLGISLLFSKKAPDTKELEKAKLQLDKLNACEST